MGLQRPTRTTLTLADDLAAILNRKARHSGRSSKEVVNAAILRGLALGEPPAQTREQAFVVHPQASGLMPGIDPLALQSPAGSAGPGTVSGGPDVGS